MEEQLHHQRVTVHAGEHELCMQRYFKSVKGPVLFLLSDAGSSSQQQYDQNSNLITQLTDQGFDVFVADWRGKGASRPLVTRRSDWGLHQLVCEDIPALLAKLESLRSAAPLLCMSGGAGSVLLLASLSRYHQELPQARAFVHLNPARRLLPAQSLSGVGGLAERISSAASRMILGCAGWKRDCRESARMYRELQDWKHSEAWVDPEDGFNFRVAARCAQIPASLYLYSGRSQRRALQLWIDELGPHNARLVHLPKRFFTAQNPSTTRASGEKVARESNLSQIHGWIDEFIET